MAKLYPQHNDPSTSTGYFDWMSLSTAEVQEIRFALRQRTSHVAGPLLSQINRALPHHQPGSLADDRDFSLQGQLAAFTAEQAALPSQVSHLLITQDRHTQEITALKRDRARLEQAVIEGTKRMDSLYQRLDQLQKNHTGLDTRFSSHAHYTVLTSPEQVRTTKPFTPDDRLS